MCDEVITRGLVMIIIQYNRRYFMDLSKSMNIINWKAFRGSRNQELCNRSIRCIPAQIKKIHVRWDF
jgi:hypothetical protein